MIHHSFFFCQENNVDTPQQPNNQTMCIMQLPSIVHRKLQTAYQRRPGRPEKEEKVGVSVTKTVHNWDDRLSKIGIGSCVNKNPRTTRTTARMKL